MLRKIRRLPPQFGWYNPKSYKNCEIFSISTLAHYNFLNHQFHSYPRCFLMSNRSLTEPLNRWPGVFVTPSLSAEERISLRHSRACRWKSGFPDRNQNTSDRRKKRLTMCGWSLGFGNLCQLWKNSLEIYANIMVMKHISKSREILP